MTQVLEVIFHIVAAWLVRLKDALIYTSAYFFGIFDFKAA